MKKFILLLILLCSTPAFANTDKRVVLNSTIPEVEKIILNTINMYDGTLTIREINKKEHRYVADYNGTTILGIIGVSNKNWSKDKYIRGSFACNLKQINEKDVLISNVKYSYRMGWIFNHYKRLYKELEFNGKKVIKYNDYIEIK